MEVFQQSIKHVIIQLTIFGGEFIETYDKSDCYAMVYHASFGMHK